MSPKSRAILQALGARIVTLKPVVQIDRTVDMSDATDVLGDEQMRLKEWFGQHPGSIVLLRPDRFVAGISYPIEVNELIAAVADKMGLAAAGGKAK